MVDLVLRGPEQPDQTPTMALSTSLFSADMLRALNASGQGG
jgi:hypothetical protein